MKTSLSMAFLIPFYSLFLSGCGDFSSSPSAPAGPETSTLQSQPPAAQNLSRELLNTNESQVSYCEVLGTDLKTYSRSGSDTELLPLASLSKLFTTAWALHKWGPDFRFTTQVIYKKVSGSEALYDVAFSTSADPIFNREKVLILIHELNRRGVKNIRHLLIDSKSRIFLGALQQPSAEIDSIPVTSQETIDNLELMFNSDRWASSTQNSLKVLERLFTLNDINWNSDLSIKTQSVKVIASLEEFSAGTVQSFTLLSAPLKSYLKNMNVYSNNYLADVIFFYLGGLNEFQKFSFERLRLQKDQIKFYTGSGMPFQINGVRQDNKASCYATLKAVVSLKNQIQQKGLSFEDVMLEPLTDSEGTFKNADLLTSTFFIKTGRLFEVPTLNVAGWSLTPKGPLHFVFMGHDFSSQQAEQLEKTRLMMMQDIEREYGIKKIRTQSSQYNVLIDLQSLKTIQIP